MGTKHAFKRWTPFWDRIDIRGPDECWEWQGHVNWDGYGHIKFGDTQYRVHRYAYAISNGIDPNEITGYVLHSCDNPPCCNPAHLREGTQAENVQDMYERGRQNVARSHCLKGHELTADNVYVHRKTGKRRCATCHKRRQAEFDLKKKGKS